MFSNELICNILDYLNKNFNDQIKIDELSYRFFYNRTYIMKRFKKELGISIIDYLNLKRIYESLKYFQYNKSILEIALLNGFNSQEYYSEIFKKIIGVSPLIYKKYHLFILKMNKDNIYIIQSNLIQIESILNKITKYQNNRKPKTMVKKLSIFNK